MITVVANQSLRAPVEHIIKGYMEQCDMTLGEAIEMLRVDSLKTIEELEKLGVEK